jgi:ribosomal protein S18 acetylase RimI-like enzyme
MLQVSLTQRGPRVSAQMLSRRPATHDDVPYLLQLRLRTLAVQLAQSGEVVSAEQHLARLMDEYHLAEVVLDQGAPVGMVKVQRGRERWTIVQLQVSPERQGRGIGTWLLREIIREAAEAGTGLALFVYRDNPAKRLYASLGFVIAGGTDSEDYMRLETSDRPIG